MKKLVESFAEHLKEAIVIAGNASISKTSDNIENVLMLGMGGSGIVGSIAAQVLEKEIKVPIMSCKDYSIPAFVSQKTLVIASSYSGNTEETLSALSEAEEKTDNIVCICSGGKIKDRMEEKGYGHIVIPGGMPPRAAFGYSFPQIFAILNAYDLISWNIRSEFELVIQLLENESVEIKNEAGEVAELLHDKLPVLYAESGFEGLCIRFRQQINENSKKLCWHHVIPEMNHNELVGWRSDAANLAVVMLRNESDLSRNKKRMELSKEIFAKYNPEIIEINSKGENKLQRTLYLVHFCDWISVYIAEINRTDSVEIEVINYFKSELGKS